MFRLFEKLADISAGEDQFFTEQFDLPTSAAGGRAEEIDVEIFPKARLPGMERAHIVPRDPAGRC
jgi:hypothetical protein